MTSQRARRWEAPVPRELWMCVVVSPVASAVCVSQSREQLISLFQAAWDKSYYDRRSGTTQLRLTHTHAQLDGTKCCLTSHVVEKRLQQQSFKNISSGIICLLTESLQIRILHWGGRGVCPETLPRGRVLPVRESQHSVAEKKEPERATEKEIANSERRWERHQSCFS